MLDPFNKVPIHVSSAQHWQYTSCTFIYLLAHYPVAMRPIVACTLSCVAFQIIFTVLALIEFGFEACPNN